MTSHIGWVGKPSPSRRVLKPERESRKRTIFASDGSRPLHPYSSFSHPFILTRLYEESEVSRRSFKLTRLYEKSEASRRSPRLPKLYEESKD